MPKPELNITNTSFLNSQTIQFSLADRPSYDALSSYFRDSKNTAGLSFEYDEEKLEIEVSGGLPCPRPGLTQPDALSRIFVPLRKQFEFSLEQAKRDLSTSSKELNIQSNPLFLVNRSRSVFWKLMGPVSLGMFLVAPMAGYTSDANSLLPVILLSTALCIGSRCLSGTRKTVTTFSNNLENTSWDDNWDKLITDVVAKMVAKEKSQKEEFAHLLANTAVDGVEICCRSFIGAYSPLFLVINFSAPGLYQGILHRTQTCNAVYDYVAKQCGADESSSSNMTYKIDYSNNNTGRDFPKAVNGYLSHLQKLGIIRSDGERRRHLESAIKQAKDSLTGKIPQLAKERSKLPRGASRDKPSLAQLAKKETAVKGAAKHARFDVLSQPIVSIVAALEAQETQSPATTYRGPLKTFNRDIKPVTAGSNRAASKVVTIDGHAFPAPQIIVAETNADPAHNASGSDVENDLGDGAAAARGQSLN